MNQEIKNLEFFKEIFNTLKTGVVIFKDSEIVDLNDSAKELLNIKDLNENNPYYESLLALVKTKENNYSKQLTGIVGKPLTANLKLIGDYSLVELTESFETRLGEASHELRRPLTNVKTLVDTLHLWGAAEDPVARKKFLGQLHTEVQRLTKLVEELLNLSRIQAGSIPLEIHQIALKFLIQETIDMLEEQASEKGVEIINNIPDNFVLVADMDKITHVIQNLIENAIRYNQPNGKVIINPIQNKFSFSIEDTGKGIAKENLPHIFERFKRFNKEVPGTGLGLAIVKSIVDLHGGKIIVDSEIDKSTKFTIEIPPREMALPPGA
ncbi:MAG: HAMP domain-containing sensor histidine kinase [Candidatus Caenarcaniphilales bacterium]|nr:HAMP domain-containing sensor histidine kinase [Candidatus Caenarcaniphilales bacterium]